MATSPPSSSGTPTTTGGADCAVICCCYCCWCVWWCVWWRGLVICFRFRCFVVVVVVVGGGGDDGAHGVLGVGVRAVCDGGSVCFYSFIGGTAADVGAVVALVLFHVTIPLPRDVQLKGTGIFNGARLCAFFIRDIFR